MTQEFRARLIALRSEGLTLSRMAAALSQEFGANLTRNAIAGVIHRAGLPRLPKRPPAPSKRKRQGKRKPGSIWLKTGFGFTTVQPPNPAPLRRERQEHHDRNIPIAQRRSLLELTEATCRWPVGDPRKEGFFFCAAQTVAGKPYCRGHLARAWGGLP